MSKRGPQVTIPNTTGSSNSSTSVSGGARQQQQHHDVESVIVEEVKKSLKEIRADYIQTQSTSIKGALTANESTLAMQIMLQKDLVKKPPKFLGEWYPTRIPRPTEAQTKTVDLKMNKTQTTAIESLGFDKLIPKYTHWTPVKRNFKVDDDPVLRHLPYFGDEDNETFDYLSYYDSNSLVEEDKDEVYRTEAVLKVLRMKGFSDHKVLELYRGRMTDLTGEDKKAQDVVVALAKIFRVEPDTMMERVVAALEKKLQALEQPPPVTKSIENIDNPQAEITEDNCLDSFLNLFCRRCFRYDCQLHGITADVYYRNKGKNAETSPPDERPPCGPNCFKSHVSQHGSSATTTTASSSSTLSRAAPAASTHETTQNEGGEARKRNRDQEWSNVENTLLAMARDVFHKGNYCDVALMVKTKTCLEVFERTQSFGKEGAAGDALAVLEEEKTIKKRKKSRSKVNLLNRQTRKVPNLRREGSSESMVEYSPCTHEGPCDDKCSCFTSNNYCEKFCQCDSTCKNRFPGCRCKRNCDTRQCPCFAALRECDPDVCGICGAGENLREGKCRCQNVVLQRDLRKHTVVGESEIAGWGLFLKESAKKNELIGEYIGEVISQEEADRRGKVYDKHAISFLFNLNQDYCVDAHRKGNKLRFANHSISPNCHARVLMVNGDYRIGIFAKYDIAAGEELFFDYRYGDEALKFVPVELTNQRLHQDSMSGSEGSSDQSDYDF